MNTERILHLPDSFILELGTRASGYVDYRIGRRITVVYRGNGKFLCLKCHKLNGCCHATRIDRYRSEHLERLNFAVADPSTGVPIV